MKKRAVFLFLIAAVLAAAVTGCGQKKQADLKDSDTDTAEDKESYVSAPTETETAADTEDTSQLKLGSAVEIPAGFENRFAETAAHPRLDKAIAEYCGAAAEDYDWMRYYYNYVDLNDDGQNEILALVLGQPEVGMEGNLLLWLDETEDTALTSRSIRQAFHQVGVPVYISDHMTEGYRDLILVEDETYRLLTWKGEAYQEQKEGTPLFSLTGYEGIAILTNHIESDMPDDNGYFPGEDTET